MSILSKDKPAEPQTGQEVPPGDEVVSDGLGDSPAEGALQPGGSRVTGDAVTRVDRDRVSRDLRSSEYIPEERIRTLDSAVLRAVASDRGYDMLRGGDAGTQGAFIRAQAEDPRFKADHEVAEKAREKAEKEKK